MERETPQALSVASGNRSGAVLITVLVVVAIISSLALFVSTSTRVEYQVANNQMMSVTAFYAAEMGIDQAAKLLAPEYNSSANSWSSALTGATSYYCQECGEGTGGASLRGGAWLDNGINLITNARREVSYTTNLAHQYSVSFWNNDDGYACSTPAQTSPTLDCDGIIIARSTGQVINSSSGEVLARSTQEATFTGVTAQINTQSDSGKKYDSESGGPSVASGAAPTLPTAPGGSKSSLNQIGQ